MKFIGAITDQFGVPIPFQSLVAGEVVRLKNADGLLVKIVINEKTP